MSETKERSGSKEKLALASQVKRSFPVAGIGASAGGLDAIQKLLTNLPQDTGLAFVVIQHLAANQESMLPEILARSTKCLLTKLRGVWSWNQTKFM